MNPRETIEAGIRGGYLPEATREFVPVLEAHGRATAVIDASPFIASEKAKRRAEAKATVREQIGTLVESAKERAVRPLDQEEGRLRASARNGHEGAEAQAATLGTLAISQIEATTDTAKIISIFADAEFTESEPLIRLVGVAARARLRGMAANDAGKPTSTAQQAYLAFDARFTGWEREHPTTRQRVEAIARQRHQATTAIEEAASFATRLFTGDRVRR